MSEDTKQELVEQMAEIIEESSDTSGVPTLTIIIDLILTSPYVREYWRVRAIEAVITVRCGANKDDHPTDKANDHAVDNAIEELNKVFTDTGDKDV